MIPLNFQTLWLNIYPFNNEFIFLHLYISLLYAVVEEFFDTNFSKKSQIFISSFFCRNESLILLYGLMVNIL